MAHGAKRLLLSDKKILFFLINSILGTLPFTASAHWAPLNFYKTTLMPRIYYPCYLILKPDLSKRHLHLRDFQKGYKNPVISNPSGRFHLQVKHKHLPLRYAKLSLRNSIYKLYINTVYLLLMDVKLLLRDSVYKLYINIVYFLLRDAKLLRDSVCKLKINTSFWGMPTSLWGISY